MGAPALPGGSPMSGIGNIPDRAAEPLGHPPLPTSPRAIALGNFGAVRRHRHRRAGARAAAVFSPPPFLLPLPPFRGEVGRGVPPLGAPALPGGSPMSGTGKIPDRAAEPPGQPPSRPPPGQSHLEISGRFADIAIAGQGRARPPFSLLPPSFFPSPLQGGGREGGPAFGCAGAPRRFTDERDREDPRPGRRAPGSTPLPTSPLPGGRREDPGARREDGAARLPVRPSRAFPNGPLTPPPVQGG